MSGSQESVAALVVDDLRKSFGATHALDGVSFSIADGEAHALLGENGAGKSTLIKILSGLTVPDTGSMTIFGEQAQIRSPRDAHTLGIRTAFQEISLVPDLSVAENLMLPDPPLRFGLVVDRRRATEWVDEVLHRYELTEVDPRADVRSCALPIRQKLEIARALSRQPKILLLDEPTSSLSSQGVEWLSRRMDELRQSGTTVVFITHRMREVRRFCDRLTILRNGRHAGSFDAPDISDADVIKLVIGHSFSSVFPARPPSPPHDSAPALAVRDLTIKGKFERVTLEVWPGEILGVAGLQGMGQNELFYSLFGLTPTDGGSIEVRGETVALASPRDAIDAGIGISLVPEDRKSEALALRLSGLENASLPVIDRFARFGWLNLTRERHTVDRVLELLQVHPRALYRPCSTFSGGNQQKIAIAKWLLAESRILLLFDPTRGVDIGTKHEIYVLMRQFADAGGAVLFYSTDVLEIVNLCDRVVVIYGGKLCAEQRGDAITEESVMQAALGGTEIVERRQRMVAA